MKARTMVYLEQEQLETLRAEANENRVSLAEVIRRALQDHIDSNQVTGRVAPETWLNIVGLGECGRADVSEQHDRCLGEALEREHTG